MLNEAHINQDARKDRSNLVDIKLEAGKKFHVLNETMVEYQFWQQSGSFRCHAQRHHSVEWKVMYRMLYEFKQSNGCTPTVEESRTTY